MNRRKLLSGISALAIYLGLIFLILFYYNIHSLKEKKYVDKNSNRVTVTFVNSSKTVFNKKSKKNSLTNSIVTPPIPLHRPFKQVEHKKKVHLPKVKHKRVVKPKKHVVKKQLPKKHVVKKQLPKKHVVKKHLPKKHVVKKHLPKKHVVKKYLPKKHVIKKQQPIIPKRIVPKEVIPEEIYVPQEVKIKKRPHKRAKDIFANIHSKKIPKKAPVIHAPPAPKIKAPVIYAPPPPPKIKAPIFVPSYESNVKHDSSVLDRIQNTHQSARVSNVNRDSGVKNTYIAKVERYMRNWDAPQKGNYISISLTIYKSGKFSYRIRNGANGVMRSSLENYLSTLNRIGLGEHSKSSPYHINVNFTTN